MVVFHHANGCNMINTYLGNHGKISMRMSGRSKRDVNTRHENMRSSRITQFIIIRLIMVDYFHGMRLKHVMGLYGGTGKPFSRRMRINVHMLDRHVRNASMIMGQVRVIMPFLHEEIVLYVEEMDPLPRYVSTNAITYPRKT